MKQTVMYSFVIHKEKNGFFNFTKFVANIIDENSIAHIKLFRVECYFCRSWTYLCCDNDTICWFATANNQVVYWIKPADCVIVSAGFDLTVLFAHILV